MGRSRNSSGGSGRGESKKARRDSSNTSTTQDKMRHSSGESMNDGKERISRQSSVESGVGDASKEKDEMVTTRTLRNRQSNGGNSNVETVGPSRKRRVSS